MKSKRDDLENLINLISSKLVSGLDKSLTIYNDYVHITQQNKEDFSKGFIHDRPLSALSRLTNNRFESVISFSSAMGQGSVTWLNDDPKVKISAPENWIVIYKALTLLTEKGGAIFLAEPALWSSKRGKLFLQELEQNKFYLNALFELPQNSIDFTQLRPYLYFFSRTKNKNLFVAELNESSNISKITDNYKLNISNNSLYEGLFVESKTFKNFQSFRVAKEFGLLIKQYNTFEKFSIKEIVAEVKTNKFYEDENSIYLRIAGNFKSVQFDEITTNKYVQLKLDSKKVNAKYFHYFLNTEIGQKFLNSYSTGAYIPHLSTVDLLDAELYLLPIEMQKRTIKTVSELKRITIQLQGFESNLLFNPLKSNEVDQDLKNLLKSLTILSEEDEFLSRLRNGEDLHTEFKSTLSWDLHQKKNTKDREHDVLRTICGFMNTDGGVLFVGVEDNGNLLGVDVQSFANNDKYLLHFKSLIKDQIGASYYPLIEYKITRIGGADILIINVQKSDEPVYLGNEQLFYVRANPSTDELKGRELVQYIQNHFKKYD